MSRHGSRYDVVVVGAGFAGCTAARDLTEQGNRVLLLEAQDRLGGRTYSTKFPGTDHDVELGGQFFVPGVHVELEREMERYGVETLWVADPDSYPTIMNGTRNPGPFPVPVEQMFDLERAAIHCVLAASRIQQGVPIDHQDLADLDVPLSEFLAPLNLPAETYEFVTTMHTLFACRPPEDGSALQLLVTLAQAGLSPLTLWGALGAHVHTEELLKHVAAEVTEVRLESPVARVDQSGDDVLVTTAAGETFSASAVVVSVPVNIWNDIEFVPQLSETKRTTSAERHGTEGSAKVLMRVRNSLVKPFVLGSPQSTGGVFGLFVEDEFDNGDQLMVMFAQTAPEDDERGFNFDERESVERGLEIMVPGAELVECISHNYNTDPFSKGDWISWRPGRISRSHSLLSAAEDRIVFATADVALKALSLIEGAVLSGHHAAQQAQDRLVSKRESAVVRER